MAVSTPILANWATIVQPTAVDNVACSRIVDPTVLAAKTHPRRLLRTTANPPRAATTTAATTVGTPTLASLAMMPHNFHMAMQASLKTLARQPMRQRFSSSSKACPQLLPPAPKPQVCGTGPYSALTPTDDSREFCGPAEEPPVVRLSFPPRR